MQTGRLVVRTPDAEYSYAVVGRAPTYSPPVVASRLLQPTAAFSAHATASGELQAAVAARQERLTSRGGAAKKAGGG